MLRRGTILVVERIAERQETPRSNILAELVEEALFAHFRSK
jgi:hypothetical protein